MFCGLTSEYDMDKHAVTIHFSRDKQEIMGHVGDVYLNLSVQGKIARSNGQA